jgi:uncharacterized protein
MIQNFIKGIVVGGAVAAVGLGVVSQLAPMPSVQAISAAPEPQMPAPQTPEPQAPEPAAIAPKPPAEASPEPAAAPLTPTVSAVPPAVPQPPVSAPAPQVAGMTQPAPTALPSEPAPLPEVSVADAAPPPAAAPPAPAQDALLSAPIVIPAPEAAPLVIAAPEPQVVNPPTALPKTVEGVTLGRLPSIGVTQAAPAPSELAPLVKFARAFTNDAAKPLFAVVLQDSGAADLDRQALAALPFPISFVLDPTDPSASEAAKIYRAGGQEVVMLASGIPPGATSSDLEQSFQVNDAVLPEAVAVMDLAKGGFQDNRSLSGEVVTVVKAMGRGLLTFDRGLNSASQIARREGLASAVIFRMLDAQGEAAPVIRRYLDRAAFKAAQEGRVVVLGTTSPEMISALMEWAVEGRGATVALAPISAVLAP